MKKSTILLPFFAAALMVGCSKDADLSGNPTQPDEAKGAYVSVAITNMSTRADAPDQDGTEAESTVSTVKLLIFDKDYNYIGLGEKGSPATDNKFVFEVAPDAYRFFVIVNSTPTIDAALSSISGNWNTVEGYLQSVLSLETRASLSEYNTDGAFTMVSAGSYIDNKETILSTPTELVNDKLSTNKELPTKISINVDRIVAKFSSAIGEDFIVKDACTDTAAEDPNNLPEGKVEGVRLNVVNRKSYIYSHIKKVNSVGNDYRNDPNMSVEGEPAQAPEVETSLTSNFFWLHNYESPVFNPAEGYSDYVFENEATGEFFNYNNLTQLVVKATYVPTGQPNPENLGGDYSTKLQHKEGDMKSWFAIDIEDYGTMQMTFEGVTKFYAADETSDDTRAKMDRQLQHMLAQAEILNGLDAATATWASPELTIEVLNSIPNGGYVAATVEDELDYIVQYYQFGLNYYDIFIQHDENEEIGHLGRWGMVRNNHYTLTINSITGPGLPYIPDPTDPEIKDPNNPDPLDPEPADKGMAYIEATIVVNPWTMWTQDVDLN